MKHKEFDEDEEGFDSVSDGFRAAIISCNIHVLSEEINRNIQEFATESSRDKKDKRELKALHKEIGKRLDKLKQMRLTHLEVLGGFESDE